MLSANAADPLPAQAVCPEHPERPSLDACARCGRFLCQECLASREPPRCAPCDVRERDSLGLLAQPFSLLLAFRHGWMLYRRAFPGLLVGALFFCVPRGLLIHTVVRSGASSSRLQLWDTLFACTVGLLYVTFSLSLMVRVAEGGPPGLGVAVREGLRAWPRVFWARFRATVVICLFFLLLIIPGFLQALRLYISGVAAFREPGSDALESSRELVSGNSWEVLGLIVGSYLLIYSVAGLFNYLLLQAYPRLSAPPLVKLAFSSFGVLLIGIFVAAVELAAFYGLKRTHGRVLAPR